MSSLVFFKKYKLNSNGDVCFNFNNCVTTLKRIWPYNKIKLTECNCAGKYSYKCNRNYCASNKLACEGLIKNITKIKKCLKEMRGRKVELLN